MCVCMPAARTAQDDSRWSCEHAELQSPFPEEVAATRAHIVEPFVRLLTVACTGLEPLS